MKKASIIVCMLILCSAGILYFILPQTIPIHFGVSGVDAYGDKATIFIFPAASLIITAVFLLTRRIDPKKANYMKFKKPFYTIIFIVNLILFGLLLLMLFETYLPNTLNIALCTCILMGGLFMFIGNLLPKIKANYMLGVRTPWTLASEEVWYQTHRFCGKLWFFSGLSFLLAGFVLLPTNVVSEEVFAYVQVVFILIIAFIPLVYSYLKYKKQTKDEELKHD